MGGGDAACTRRASLKAAGARARAERTENMLTMLVTLDVSKLSGWLNFDANCRVERRACERPGRREGAGWRRRKWCARGGLKAVGARARAERTVNIWYMVVTLDVSKLSGWLNTDAPCRVERRACSVRRGVSWEA